MLVLLFVALASSFDRQLIVSFESGWRILALGLAFSVVVSEVVLRCLRIRLPWLWRGPYHLILGLLFLYPIWVAMAIGDVTTRQGLAWRVMLFSPVSAVAALSLLPAASRGRGQPRSAGVPWPWPGFPWSLFVVLAVAVILRMYFLSLAFDPVVDERPTIQPFFFVPPLAAILLVTLELSVAAGWWRTTNRCLALPALLPALALWTNAVGSDGEVFVEMLARRAGTPLYLTLWLLAAYYAYAYCRLRLPLGLAGLWISLAALARVDPQTESLAHLAPLQWPSLAALMALHLGFALRGNRSGHWLLAGLLGVALVAVVGQESWPAEWFRISCWHAAIVVLLLAGAIWNDLVGRLARVAGAVALCVAGIVALRLYDALPASVFLNLAAYEIGLVALALIYAYSTSSPTFAAAAAINALASLTFVSRQALVTVKASSLGAGVDLLAAGGLFLVVATAISLAKAGCLRRVAKLTTRPQAPD